MQGVSVRFEIPPAPQAAVDGIVAALGVHEVTAQVLVRRGLADPDAAARFLAAEERHPLEAFDGLREAAERILGHVRRRGRIVVHGDYDCDGVCATATLVRAVRQVGGDVTWFVPHRLEDGYGLGADTVRRLAGDGFDLVVTVDCGVTAVDEAALAAELGLDLVVTDHHRPRADGALPAVPIAHPGLPRDPADPDGPTRYPAPELCGAGVAWRLAGALLAAAGHDPAGADIDLDLVAIATIADVVPLRGENRWIVRRGLQAITDSRRPGLRALLDVSRTAPADVDERSVAFRLAPRINAAGRVGDANAAVALLVEHDPGEARRLADRLDLANRDRRELERRILREAEGQADAQGEQPAYVLAGEGWHPGVVGIVASRIVERTGRPAVLLAIDGEEAVGSGRSVPGFDLLAGLDACADRLLAHGGHRAAAGLRMQRDAIDGFAAAFRAHAAEHLDEDALVAVERVDAIVGGADLSLGLAEQLLVLGPFGEGNPEPVLQVVGARGEGVRTLGSSGSHLAFTVRSGGTRIAAVAFGCEELPCPDGPFVGSFALERHAFAGSVLPRLRARRMALAAPSAIDRLDGDPLDAALSVLEAEDPFPSPADPGAAPTLAAAAERLEDRAPCGAVAALAALVATGEPVVALVADARRRHAQLAPMLGGFALTDWWSAVRTPATLDGAVHLVAVDPPSDAAHLGLLDALPDGRAWRTWGDPELRFTVDALHHEHDLRGDAIALFRDLRTAGPSPFAALLGERPGWRLGLLLRVLEECGAVVVDRAERIVAPGSGPVAPLEDGPTHRAWTARGEERHRWLSIPDPRRAPLRA